jgi:ribonuclease P protein component
MISKVNRFHGHNSLSTVYRRGQTVSVPYASLKYLIIRPEKQHRLAIVVSRKVDKSAVVRNRIRRRIYEAMRDKYPNLKENVDIVITVHKNQIATMPASELSELVDQMLTKAGLISL